MTDLSFIDYWNAVDAALEKFFGLHSGAAGVAPYRIAIAQEEGDDPEQLPCGSARSTASPVSRRPRYEKVFLARSAASRYGPDPNNLGKENGS